MMEFEEYLRTDARRKSTAEWLDGFFYSRITFLIIPRTAIHSKGISRDGLISFIGGSMTDTAWHDMM